MNNSAAIIPFGPSRKRKLAGSYREALCKQLRERGIPFADNEGIDPDGPPIRAA